MTKDEIEQLFRANYQTMFVLANRLLHNADVAKDIVHDVFASLLSGKVGSVNTAYLLSGVRFACLKYIRALSTRERMYMFYSLDFHEIEDENWPDEEIIATINEIVEELPEPTRKIVLLRFRGKMTYKEIAEELSLSEVSIYKHLRHALNVLRKNLKVYER